MDKFSDDIELIKRLKKGDIEAFDSIYEKYSGSLYAFSMKYLRISSEAEELVQLVFVKIWENRKQIDLELSFRAYLFKITYNDICKIFRRRNYLRRFIVETFYEKTEFASETEENIDYQSTLARVNQVIDMLPEKQKIIFRKSRLEGKTTKEISKEMGLSPGTVDNYISEALKFLRNRLKDEKPE
ncbi:MAG TPA: RNA polymerase sigma-70 factor [Bacteroidales bacterium]|nr:RNA polymerase sigma-70 factor [Bacteroidales bacterium]